MPPPRFRHAIVRPVSRSLAQCELAHLPRQTIDLARARRQHAQYVDALEAAGVTVQVLPEAPDLADSGFVEDPVVILDEVAVLGRPGAASRAAEVELIAPAAQRVRPVVRIESPATLEGGDVLRIGRTLFVGLSARTSRGGADQLSAVASRFGYRVVPVPVSGCLHLKTGATSPGGNVVLVNSAWIDLRVFTGCEIIHVPAGEPWGANILPVNGRVFAAAAAPRTGEILATRGFAVQPLDISELQKAEAGLTCLSVLYA